MIRQNILNLFGALRHLVYYASNCQKDEKFEIQGVQGTYGIHI